MPGKLLVVCIAFLTLPNSFVDAIHTNHQIRVPRVQSRIGSRTPFGHIDFYPNGGATQPHCEDRWWNLPCNHYASVDFFRASVQYRHLCTFTAGRCKRIDIMNPLMCTQGPMSSMGFFADMSKGRGIYYLQTQKFQPYCVD